MQTAYNYNMHQTLSQRIWPFIAAVCVIALGMAIVIIPRLIRPYSLPRDIVKQVDFTLYTPIKLPAKSQIRKESVGIKQGIVTYVIDDDGNDIFVSQQAKPNGFDFEKLYTNQFRSTAKVSTENGEAVIGTLRSSTAASLITIDSWILLTGTSDTPKTDIDTIVKSLQKNSR